MERDCSGGPRPGRWSYFNPRAPHGARRERRAEAWKAKMISIHALRMERDKPLIFQQRKKPISIHALRMERDVTT